MTPNFTGFGNVTDRGKHDVVELQVRCSAISEFNHRKFAYKCDHLRRRAIQQRCLATALEALQRARGCRRQKRGVHPGRSEHHSIASINVLCGELNSVIRQADD